VIVVTGSSMVARPTLVGLMVSPTTAHRRRTRLYRAKKEPVEDGDENQSCAKSP
jgi:hypothetical protein